MADTGREAVEVRPPTLAHVLQVVGLGSEQQMIRPHARHVVAAVAHHLVGRQRPIRDQPGHAVRELALLANAEATV